MRVFIAGVMQGTRTDHLIDDQDYRQRIAAALAASVPGVAITDPWALNPDSVNYEAEQARHTFLTMTAAAAEADVLIAYLPKPSMGTAMEMWSAFQAGRYIIAVTPLLHHWAIRFTANEIFPDLESLLAYIESGRFTALFDTAPPAD
jgi:hypothetical protein